ncbi:hypothetical protein L1887_34735 [Cichorium endivia]|nr:hypothetical protein L1887_34735 [Cichorium endivia]
MLLVQDSYLNSQLSLLHFISASRDKYIILPITIGKDPTQTKALKSQLFISLIHYIILTILDVQMHIRKQYYDYDQLFPSWGFGARPIDGPVNHCFNLNGSSANPPVAGIKGIMSAYQNALSNVSLVGPTLFGPAAANIAN